MGDGIVGVFNLECLSPLCEKCDKMKLTVERLYADGDIAETIVVCENRAICERISILMDPDEAY